MSAGRGYHRSISGVEVKDNGILDGEWFYGIRYAAPQRHYFDKDLKIFETVLRSFKLKTTA